jgi:DNA polymerase V
VLDISLKPKQGSQVLIQHGGGTELATLRGKSLITEDGEAIEENPWTMLLSSAS